jgi:hypothetical protein
MDALWGTSYEHYPPSKFLTTPFNNDWSSSIIASLDPVAIESVCLDIMQKEFTVEDPGADPPREVYVRFSAVDDYLHQAASSDWWPEGVTYDPDNTGSPIGSLGVHEHWNNTSDMEYSRDLETGSGIELVKSFHEQASSLIKRTVPGNINIYPNPCKGHTNIYIDLEKSARVSVEIYTSSGARLLVKYMGNLIAGAYEIPIITEGFTQGVYFCRLNVYYNSEINTITKKLVID